MRTGIHYFGVGSLSERVEDTVEFVPTSAFEDTFFSSQETLPVAFGAATHVGHVRSENEDHFAVFRFRRTADLVLASLGSDDLPVRETCSYAMAIADGMGGMKSGELASRVALQTMADLAGQATSWVMKLSDLGAQQIEKRVRAYVDRIHAALKEKGRTDPQRKHMGTTWTSAHLIGRSAVVVHIGDSRAYLFRNGTLRQITRDETVAQSLIDSGMEPATVERFRHILLNSFGGGNETARASIYDLELATDDKLLLCSDGLTDMVSIPEIVSELSQRTTPQLMCDALVQRSLANGGKDNVTVVLAELPTEPEAA